MRRNNRRLRLTADSPFPSTTLTYTSGNPSESYLYFSLKSSSGQIASDNKTRNMRYRWGGRIQMSYKC